MMGTETNTCDSATAAETEVVETTPADEEVVVLETVTSEGLLGLKKHTWKHGGAC